MSSITHNCMNVSPSIPQSSTTHRQLIQRNVLNTKLHSGLRCLWCSGFMNMNPDEASLSGWNIWVEMKDWRQSTSITSLSLSSPQYVQANAILASCPLGPVTANGVDLLTAIYVIYMETHTSHCTIRFVGPSAEAGGRRKDGWTDGRKARKYISMLASIPLWVSRITSWHAKVRSIYWAKYAQGLIQILPTDRLKFMGGKP